MNKLVVFAIALVGSLNGRAWGEADSSSDIRRGRELAEKLCSSCHIVSPDQKEGAAHSGAPSFKNMADGQRTDTESLRAFFNATQSNVSHTGAMPNPLLRNEEIEKISGYIRSLGKH